MFQPQRVDPITGFLNFMSVLAETGGNSNRSSALNIELPGHEIDTCLCTDTGYWETGIKPSGGKWIIVQQYPNQITAEQGHQEWIKKLTENPALELVDIDLWSLGLEESDEPAQTS